jgi:UDP-N-acetylmuramoyl-tripeptide--D-alanyl-D-alanine ligase
LNEICAAVSGLEPVPHRLEIIKNNGINIIDDSYNASAEGTAAAVEVLSQFNSGRKIVVTPGIVELGEKQDKENFNFGVRLAQNCDYIILVGENQTLPIRQGILSKGFDEAYILTVSSLDEAKEKLSQILKSGDTVLFENDLPDNYSEQ